jgi:hypothetical protein
MKQNQLIDINQSETAVAWALDQAKRGDREALRWLQDRRLEGNEAASLALVELALMELGSEFAVSLV